MAKKWQIPFTPDGHMISNLLVFNSYAYPSIPAKDIDWRDNYKFEAMMAIKNYYRGRTAVGIILRDADTGTRYDINMSNFMDVVHKMPIYNGIIPKTKWTFVKRGPAISLKLVEEKKNEQVT